MTERAIRPGEGKVIYIDDGRPRALRGRIDDTSDPDFVIVHRDDGLHKIARTDIRRVIHPPQVAKT